MKHTLFAISIVVFLCAFSSCGKTKAGSSSPEDTISKDASYALGMNVGTSLKTDYLYPDLDEFVKGIKDVLYDSETRFPIDEAYQIFNEAFSAAQDKRNTTNREAETDFLAENREKPGILVTDSGLQYEVVTEGDGPKPTSSDKVRVHYEGALTDGTVFDSSYSRGEPLEFALNAVIPGWTEGLQLMNVGSTYRLFIPSNLGYGSQGAGNQIPPYSTLVFEVELLDIVQ